MVFCVFCRNKVSKESAPCSKNTTLQTEARCSLGGLCTTYLVLTTKNKTNLATGIGGYCGEAIANDRKQTSTEFQHRLDERHMKPKTLTWKTTYIYCLLYVLYVLCVLYVLYVCRCMTRTKPAIQFLTAIGLNKLFTIYNLQRS